MIGVIDEENALRAELKVDYVAVLSGGGEQEVERVAAKVEQVAQDGLALRAGRIDLSGHIKLPES
jgi:hypothetical protein